MRIFYILLLAISLRVSGATYYIAPTGGSDSNAGTEAQPWATWTKVRNTIANGDTVIARGGFWSGQTYILISAKTNITIRAYPGETPVLTTNYWVPAANATASLWIVNSSNIVIDGLTFTNNSKNIALGTTVGVQLLNCDIGQSMTTNNSVNFNVLDSVWMTISNCVINNVGIVTETGDDGGESIKIGRQTDTVETNSFGNRLLNTTWIHGGHTLPEIAGRNTVIRDCVFYNDDFFVGTNGVDTFGNRWLSFLGGNAMSNLVENCRFGYSGRPSDQPEDCAGLEISTSRNIIRRNQFYRGRGTAISLYQKGFTQQPRDNHIYHNSVLNPGWDTNVTYFWRVAYGFFHSDDVTNNRVVNNVAWDVPTNVWYFHNGATLSNKQARIAGNLDDTVNPLFTNTNLPGESSVTSPLLTLQAGSPAIDAGVWLTTITSASGSGTTFTVADSGYFYDGWGIPGEVGDLIQLQGQTATTRITSVNYETQTLTIQTPISWTNGQSLALSYYGSAPDVGAFEWNQNRMTVIGNVTVGGNLNVQGVAQ